MSNVLYWRCLLGFTPWSQVQEWAQESAIAVYEQVRQFVLLAAGHTSHLSREQKGRFVCLCWIREVFKHFLNPKASYVADWDDLPVWQTEIDADIFEAIEGAVLQEITQVLRGHP